MALLCVCQSLFCRLIGIVVQRLKRQYKGSWRRHQGLLGDMGQVNRGGDFKRCKNKVCSCLSKRAPWENSLFNKIPIENLFKNILILIFLVHLFSSPHTCPASRSTGFAVRWIIFIWLDIGPLCCGQFLFYRRKKVMWMTAHLIYKQFKENDWSGTVPFSATNNKSEKKLKDFDN